MEKSLLVIVRHKPGRTRLLMRALQSINDQTFKKINIIIFCMEEELKCHNVDDFYLKELSNIYSVIYDESCIFNAIKMSESNYLCFMDDDDSWAPEYVSRLLSVLANIQSTYSSVNAIACHTNKVAEIAENNRIIINSTQPCLQRVGPDVLDARLTPEEVKARLLSPRFRNRQFSGLLLDQSFLAGLGNYLRVEILWQVGLTGQHKAKDLNEAQLNALSHALLDIPRLSYTTRGQADENKHHGALFRFKLFHRDGEACERCGGIIEKTTLSSRPFYWCPHCQK